MDNGRQEYERYARPKAPDWGKLDWGFQALWDAIAELKRAFERHVGARKAHEPLP